MTERFKQYLEAKFRAISPTRAAMEFRKDTLVKLEELAQDYRIKGISDDEAIYNLCIDSLGDFDATLREFDKALVEIPEQNNRRKILTMSVLFAVAAILIVYLSLSMTGVIAWSLSWLILLGAAIAAYTAVDVILIIKGKQSEKYIIPRLATMLCVAFWFAYVYLIIHLCLPERLPFDWMTFLVLPIGILLEDVIFGFATKSKITIPEMLVCLITSSILIYVMCGIAHVMPWGLGWLLPVSAIILSIVIMASIVITTLKRNKNNELAKYAEIHQQVDEEYYTKW